MIKYITKDSGKRIKTKSGMVRDVQDGKPRYDLTVALTHKNDMLTRWAGVLERGMIKYGYRNWEKANSEEELIRFKASAFRHFIQWFKGEEDEDHAASVFFNINAVEYLKEKFNEKL
ncbi:MAG: dATP/dGTP diphosphohydrolase domain-containing protein [Patescibacteria group bacterium]